MGKIHINTFPEMPHQFNGLFVQPFSVLSIRICGITLQYLFKRQKVIEEISNMSMELVWRCQQLLSGLLANGYLLRVSRQSRQLIRVIMKWYRRLCTDLLAFTLQLSKTVFNGFLRWHFQSLLITWEVLTHLLLRTTNLNQPWRIFGHPFMHMILFFFFRGHSLFT